MPQSQRANLPFRSGIQQQSRDAPEEFAAIIRNDRVDDNRPHERSVVTCKRG